MDMTCGIYGQQILKNAKYKVQNSRQNKRPVRKKIWHTIPTGGWILAQNFAIIKNILLS